MTCKHMFCNVHSALPVIYAIIILKVKGNRSLATEHEIQFSLCGPFKLPYTRSPNKTN